MRADTPTCINHPASPAPHTCVRCQRTICSVCEFQTAAGSFCPECMSAGPSPEEKSASLAKAVWAVVLAVVGMVILVIGMMIAGASSRMQKSYQMQDQMLNTAVFFLAFLAALGGLALGLVSRDEARATGSPLPVVAIIANGILLGLFVLLSLVGVFNGR
jgi:hypothetical protein